MERKEYFYQNYSWQELKDLVCNSFFAKHKDGWEAQRVEGNLRKSMTQIGG